MISLFFLSNQEFYFIHEHDITFITPGRYNTPILNENPQIAI